MEYRLTKDDIDMCIKFAVDMHTEKGGSASRTTGQTRGLGTMINDWTGGKAVEIGVRNMLERYGSKKLKLDFQIYSGGKTANDPDIIEVIEDTYHKRPPNLFIEIKSVGASDRWIGLTETQFESIKNRAGGDLDRAYLIYAEINKIPDASTERMDLLGSFMKYATADTYSEWFKNYVNPGSIEIKTVCIMTLAELQKEGIYLLKGKDMVYETEIFQKTEKMPTSAYKIPMKGIIPRLEYKGYTYPDFLGDIYIDGADLFKKDNPKHPSYYICADKNTAARNMILGDYPLEKGIYRLRIEPAGRNPEMFNNAYWIALRKASQLFGHSSESRAEKIMRLI